ncbi:PREDICTED: uncharacterized protein LOC104733744 [Camelina sativa]|uniref:Uncharacterized protein LOC104733744 n=1 Tax=Camelina sativa TaxID=90675 RepID=A0ABM0V6G2_CAMSA|nr:PREDICTED: uncharacterized protein LOC104733744 [Camelina sativa]
MNTSVVSFADLKAGCLHQQIVGRMLRHWPARNVKKGGQLMGVDFLLIDEKSTVMQGSINVTYLSKFENSLRDGAIYQISGFEVTRSNYRFKLTDFHFSIRFTPTTVFDEVDESVSRIPNEHFRFRSYEQLVSLANTNTELPDIIGQVCSSKAYRNGMTQVLERMLVHISLESGEKVRLSAFDEHATSLEKLTQRFSSAELYLNATSGTKFYTDGDVATTRKYAESLKLKETEGTNSIAPSHGVEKIEHVSIDELNQFVATADPQEAEFLCNATVTDIQAQRGWSFISCAACGTKMVKKLSSLTCNNFKCGSTTAIGDVKYRVELVVHDGISTAVFVAFDKDMVKLTNIQATTLASQLADNEHNLETVASIPKVVSEIVGKKFTFQIKLTSFNFTPHHQSFTVSRIYETTEVLPGPTFKEAQGGDIVDLGVKSPATNPTHLQMSSTSSSIEKESQELYIDSGDLAEETSSSSGRNEKQKKQKCN